MSNASPVELPAALLARRRKVVEEHGEGPSDEPVTTPPAEPDVPPAATPPADPPPAAKSPATPDPAPAPDSDDEPVDGPVDLLGDLGSLLEPQEPTPPPVDPDRGEIEREKQRLREEREALDAAREEFERQQRAAQQTEKPSLKPGEVSPEALKAYEKSRDVIAHLALTAVAAQINPMLESITDRLARLEADTQTASQTAQRAEQVTRSMTDRSFNQAVVEEVGDIRPLMKNDRFAQFLLRRPQYMPDKTLKELFNAAIQGRNPTPIVSIVRAFLKSEAAAGRPLDLMRTRRTTPGSENRLPEQRPSAKLPWSERGRAWDQFRSGVISREKFDEIKARYDEAADKGLVDYDS